MKLCRLEAQLSCTKGFQPPIGIPAPVIPSILSDFFFNSIAFLFLDLVLARLVKLTHDALEIIGYGIDITGSNCTISPIVWMWDPSVATFKEINFVETN